MATNVPSYVGPYIRQMNGYPARRGRLPKLMIDRITLWRRGLGCTSIYEFHIFNPRKPEVLLGSTNGFLRAEQMVKGKVPLALEFNADAASLEEQ